MHRLTIKPTTKQHQTTYQNSKRDKDVLLNRGQRAHAWEGGGQGVEYNWGGVRDNTGVCMRLY